MWIAVWVAWRVADLARHENVKQIFSGAVRAVRHFI